MLYYKIPAKKLIIIFRRSLSFYTRQGLGLIKFSVKIPRSHTISGSSEIIFSTELRGVVDRTTAQQPRLHQFETDLE